MNLMISLSLWLNIAVLIPVCAGLITNAAWTRSSYGEATPARRILLSVYLAIAFASVAILLIRDAKYVLVLLSLQIVYKLLTPVTVGTLRNPVIVSNLVIAAVHGVTVALIWRQG